MLSETLNFRLYWSHSIIIVTTLFNDVNYRDFRYTYHYWMARHYQIVLSYCIIQCIYGEMYMLFKPRDSHRRLCLASFHFNLSPSNFTLFIRRLPPLLLIWLTVRSARVPGIWPIRFQWQRFVYFVFLQLNILGMHTFT